MSPLLNSEPNEHKTLLSENREQGVYKCGDWVERPASAWSPSVKALLDFLHSHGFTQCPRSIALDDKTETLSFVSGQTFDYPLKGSVASEEALRSAATLLREFHNVSAKFIGHDSSVMTWMLPSREPVEVICHGDFAPYNVALNKNVVTGVFDFDTAHPGPRIWDLAYAVYCWAPFKMHPDDSLGTMQTQIKRARQFCDAYGADIAQRKGLVNAMIERLQALVAFMVSQAEAENAQFNAHIEANHHVAYLNDIEYLKSHAGLIEAGII